MSGRHLQELQNHARPRKASVCMPRRREFRAFLCPARMHRSARLAGVSECPKDAMPHSPAVTRVGCRTQRRPGKKWRVVRPQLPPFTRAETRRGPGRSRELLEKHLHKKGIINFLTRVCATFATSGSRSMAMKKRKMARKSHRRSRSKAARSASPMRKAARRVKRARKTARKPARRAHKARRGARRSMKRR